MKKLVAKADAFMNFTNYKFLTEGKEYEVMSEGEEEIQIVSDLDNHHLISRNKITDYFIVEKDSEERFWQIVKELVRFTDDSNVGIEGLDESLGITWEEWKEFKSKVYAK